MHGNDGGLVGVKVDEPVAGRLTGELVCHHLEAEGISEQKQGGCLAGVNKKPFAWPFQARQFQNPDIL